MLISILVPAYARPGQLAEALESIAQQDRSLIGEIVVSDDSPRSDWAANQAAIAASGLEALVRYVSNDPSLGTYPNHWFLASTAKHDHILFLHDDDKLWPNGLRVLVDACRNESDPRVVLWFGRNLIMDQYGMVDAQISAQNDRHYGKDGPPTARPLWQWCLTESVPPNSFLVSKATYTRYMEGPRDGNIGDWAFAVRLANSDAWARFVGETISVYRVQPGSVTTAGRGMDVHRFFEMAEQLVVPPHAEAQKRARFYGFAPIATLRYLRDGERRRAWQCFWSSRWNWRQRLSARGGATLLALVTPRFLWLWALHYKS